MDGLPQSRPCENDQSRVAIRPLAPAARARSMRARMSSREPIQYIWKNVEGLAATTSSMLLLPNDESPSAVPRAAAARATATSPSGWTACTPVGEMITGSEMSWPMTVVAWSRLADRPATCGAKPSSANDAVLSAYDAPRSEPARRAPYTDGGRCFLARRCASATDSNQADLGIRCSSAGGGAGGWRDGSSAGHRWGNPRNAGTRARRLRARTTPVQRPAP